MSWLALRPTPWLALLISPTLYWICFQQFFRAGAARFLDMWLATYLQEARGAPAALANQLTSLPQWTGMAGGMLGGLVSDYLLRRTGSRRVARQALSIVSLAGAVACYVAAFFTADLYAAIAWTGAGAFVYYASAPCSYALTMDMGGRDLGVVFGAMNMFGNIGAFAFTRLAPSLKGENGGDWTPALIVFAGMHVAALLFWLLINPNGLIVNPPPPPASKE